MKVVATVSGGAGAGAGAVEGEGATADDGADVFTEEEAPAEESSLSPLPQAEAVRPTTRRLAATKTRGLLCSGAPWPFVEGTGRSALAAS